MSTEKKRSDVAVFIDFENVYVSVREKLDESPNFESIMEYCNDLGRVVMSRAYADWYRYPRITSALYANGIEPMYVPTYYYDKEMGRTGRAIKNSVDMNLCIDAMKTLFMHGNIDKFVLSTGDRDFIPLVNTIRQQGKEVIIIGIGGAASAHLAQSADDFVFYEQLAGKSTPTPSRRSKTTKATATAAPSNNQTQSKTDQPAEPDIYDTLIEAIHLVRERGYLSTLGSLKLVMKELMGGDFKENRYKDVKGRPFSKFKDFVLDAEQRGKVQIYTNGTVSEVFLPGEDAKKLSQFGDFQEDTSASGTNLPQTSVSESANGTHEHAPSSSPSSTSSSSSSNRSKRRKRTKPRQDPQSEAGEVSTRSSYSSSQEKKTKESEPQQPEKSPTRKKSTTDEAVDKTADAAEVSSDVVADESNEPASHDAKALWQNDQQDDQQDDRQDDRQDDQETQEAAVDSAETASADGEEALQTSRVHTVNGLDTSDDEEAGEQADFPFLQNDGGLLFNVGEALMLGQMLGFHESRKTTPVTVEFAEESQSTPAPQTAEPAVAKESSSVPSGDQEEQAAEQPTTDSSSDDSEAPTPKGEDAATQEPSQEEPAEEIAEEDKFTFTEEEWQAFRTMMQQFTKPVSFAHIFDSLRDLRKKHILKRTNEQLRSLVKQAINNGTLERSGRGKRVYYTLHSEDRVNNQGQDSQEPHAHQEGQPDTSDSEESTTESA